MERNVLAADLVKALPTPEPRKVARGAGEVVTALGVSFTWKVKGADTGYAFAVYEMELAPGRGIPLHLHPFAEFFYVLEGCIDLMGVDAEGALGCTPVTQGESANAPINAPHGLMNHSDRPARFLSVANFQHETLFNEFCARVEAAGPMSEQEQSAAFMQVAARYGGHIVATGVGA